MVAEKAECDGSEIEKGYLPNIEDCAANCEEISSMFAFGTNDFGTTRCQASGCKCLCETGATAEGKCNRIDHDGYLLFKYSNPPPGDYHVYHKPYVGNFIAFYNF